ncbi:MAG: DUF1080 domain-containing protein [Kiritimatiellae bacterium]|nr:DUF1080 domain-containing protein [Kiritimatiellia bacterium]
MKKTFLICFLVSLVASAAELKEPVFRMTEPELLAVLKENGLNDKVTACQELSHVGTSAAVPALAALLTDATEPALFLAARYALENIPGGEAEAALKNALAVVTDAKRRGGIEKSLRARTNPIPDGYAGASEKLTAFPPKTAVQKGDLAAVPALVETALGTGPAATLARRNLVGFPNDGIVDVLLGLLEGADVKKARLALDVLGTRRVRVEMSRLLAFARTTKHEGLRMEAFKAFATLCDPEDLPQLLALLKEFPKADRLSGSIIRVVARAFEMDTTPITVMKAEYGFFGTPRQVADIIGMVRALVGGGSRAIMASNHLAGQGGFPFDPAPGKHKELHLTYRLGDGPELSAIVQESSQIKFTDYRLPESLAKQLVSAAQAATGDERTALVRIIDTLDRRGIVPGADMVLFRPIFNGKDLTGWSQQDDYFSVKDGVITGESTPDHLCKPNHHLVYTAEELTDFELRAEFRLSKGANSGIQLRCKPQFIGDNGYQADMNGGGNFVGFLYHPKQHLIGARGSDVVIDAAGKKTVTRFADGKALQDLYRVEQWNDMRVKVEGRAITVWINGVRTTSVVDPREAFFPSKGHIALQLHQGPPMKVEFRNIRLRR